MSQPTPIEVRYLSDKYLLNNPTWHAEDSRWKARKVADLLNSHLIAPKSLIDVGCGGGGVLFEMSSAYSGARLTGYDFAPDAEQFWDEPRAAGVELVVGNFFESQLPFQDVLLLLDVLEHIQDPFAFLFGLKGRAKYYVFHFPLDLSALSVLRESRLLHVRDKVGHIHYFTRGLALAMLKDCGFEVIEARYTGAAFNGLGCSWKTTFARVPRRLAFALNHDVGARLLGGETLMVLAAEA